MHDTSFWPTTVPSDASQWQTHACQIIPTGPLPHTTQTFWFTFQSLVCLYLEAAAVVIWNCYSQGRNRLEMKLTLVFLDITSLLCEFILEIIKHTLDENPSSEKRELVYLVTYSFKTHWGRVICVDNQTIIGSDNVGAKPLSEPMLEYC